MGLSLPLLIGFVVFVALANINGLPLLADPDSHWHITVGNWILQHGAVPDGRYLLLHIHWPALDRQGMGLAGADGAGLQRRRLGRRGGAVRGGFRRHLGAAAAPAAAGHPAAAGAAVHRGGVRHDGARISWRGRSLSPSPSCCGGWRA